MSKFSLQKKNDYIQALKEIETIWNSPVNTPDGNRLEELVTAVEAYEKKHYPPLGNQIKNIEFQIVTKFKIWFSNLFSNNKKC